MRISPLRSRSPSGSRRFLRGLQQEAGMAKGQKRSNREAKKPKVKKAPSASPTSALFSKGAAILAPRPAKKS